MRFQPGQSGNPAGRPLGARNKKTLEREEKLAARAERAVERIISLAGVGNAAAMRICAEWVRPGGNSRALALELPRITCSADAQAALDMVIESFGCGEITVREFSPMLGAVDRMARVADRIAQMRDRERVGRQIRGETHPSMLPRQVGPPDPLDAAIARGEDPFADDEEPTPAPADHEGLYSPVNSDGETSGAPGETSPVAAEPSVADDDGLYFPANSDAETAGPDASEAPSQPGRPADGLHLPVNSDDEADNAGASEVSSEPAGPADDLYFPVNSNDATAGAAGEPSPVAAQPRATDDDGLYFPVNSEDEAARPAPEASFEAARSAAAPP
ncbi:MAG: hypothetical protein JO328_17080 [Hyphomicrobiales bacterium]|nr:hypothetical protein [Hyphomicrobiales bacterium]MBV8827040.1 hypothetical protein [Hyphomicrobiales bacterium]